MSELLQDLRYALRRLRRSPGFTGVAVITLALGIGANTAIFSLVYTLMLRTLPVRDSGQLVELLHRYPGEPHLNGFSWQAYQLIREQGHVFSGLIASVYQPLHVQGEAVEAMTLDGGYVDGTFFSVLGIKPAMGRMIETNDDRMGDPSPIGVLSWSCWKNRFNLDPTVIGRRIEVEGVPVTIVGVAARRFQGLQAESSQDLWLPLAMEPVIVRSGLGWGSLVLVGRLKPGVSIEQARAETAVLYGLTLDDQAKITNNPFIRKFKFEMEPAGSGLSRLREQFSKPLLVLMLVVVLVLLIACANLGGMLLARGVAREPELALRVSLGASRIRLLRQMLTESLLLSTTGGLLGMGLAYFGSRMLVQIMVATRRAGRPLDFPVRIDANVLLFTGAAALVSALMFGFVPAIRALRTAPMSSLRHISNSGEPGRGQFFGKAMVVTQVALSVVLLSAAGRFVHYLANLEHLNLGFRRDHVLVVTLDPAGSGYTDERLSIAYRELLRRLETIPGVRSATICGSSPISGAGANRAISVEGYNSQPGEIRNVMENWIGPKYFATLETPLLAGRDFGPQEESRSRKAIINRTMARYYFGERSPIGSNVKFDGEDEPYEIVGVVGDAKYMDIREATWRTIYLDTFQEPWVASQFVLRTSVDPESIAPDVRRAVRELLPTVPVNGITTLSNQIDASLVPERLIAILSGLFGMLGALLAAIGLYGLLAYTVARRTNEIGIRIALGASPTNVTRMMVGQAVGMVAAGVSVGTPIAFWCSRLATSLIRDLPGTAVVPIAFGIVAMIVIAALAAYLPTRRAASIDPMAALRYE